VVGGAAFTGAGGAFPAALAGAFAGALAFGAGFASVTFFAIA
jgi:hypothetical protein